MFHECIQYIEKYVSIDTMTFPRAALGASRLAQNLVGRLVPAGLAPLARFDSSSLRLLPHTVLAPSHLIEKSR